MEEGERRRGDEGRTGLVARLSADVVTSAQNVGQSQSVVCAVQCNTMQWDCTGTQCSSVVISSVDVFKNLQNTDEREKEKENY